MRPLFWVVILLLLLLYMMGLLCAMLMKSKTTGDAEEESWRESNEVMVNYNANMYFGSIPRCMFSLFNLVLLAEYPEFMRPLFIQNIFVWLCLTAFTFFTVF